MKFFGYEMSRKKIRFQCNGKKYFVSFKINIFGDISQVNFTEYEHDYRNIGLEPVTVIYAGPNFEERLNEVAQITVRQLLQILQDHAQPKYLRIRLVKTGLRIGLLLMAFKALAAKPLGNG